jgi:hypothetical protein
VFYVALTFGLLFYKCLLHFIWEKPPLRHNEVMGERKLLNIL